MTSSSDASLSKPTTGGEEGSGGEGTGREGGRTLPPGDMVAEVVGSFGNQKVDLPPQTRGPKGPSKFCGVSVEPLWDPFSPNLGVWKPTRGSPPLADGQASIFEATS